jgi:hypothetical protein
MHGSPMSKYDNRLLWIKYDYRAYGIIGEPYFDVDFSGAAYYTDTGRMWKGDNVSIRDRVFFGIGQKAESNYETAKGGGQFLGIGETGDRRNMAFPLQMHVCSGWGKNRARIQNLGLPKPDSQSRTFASRFPEV